MIASRRLQEAGLARAAQLLGGQRRRQPARVAHDDARAAPRAAAHGARPCPSCDADPGAGAPAARVPARRTAGTTRADAARFAAWRCPAAETSTSRSTRCGKAIASSARDEAAHRVADDGRRVDLELSEQARPAAARSRRSRSARRASASSRSRAGRASPRGARGEHRQLLEPVLPAAGQPVDEHQRLGVGAARRGRARSC